MYCSDGESNFERGFSVTYGGSERQWSVPSAVSSGIDEPTVAAELVRLCYLHLTIKSIWGEVELAVQKVGRKAQVIYLVERCPGILYCDLPCRYSR
jgi:hypothetical protein